MRVTLRGLWAEFKVFAFQGNLVELAVAVVIGAAFTNLVHAMVTDLVNPTIGHVVHSVRAMRDETTAVAEQVGLKAHRSAAASPAGPPPPQQPTAARPSTPPPPEDPRVAVLQKEVDDLMRARTEAPPPAATAPTELFKAVDLHWEVAGYPIGHFIGELINFAIVAVAIFLVIVKLLGNTVLVAAGAPRPSGPTTKECPACLSIIPVMARKCAHCGSEVTVPPAAVG